MTCRSLWSSSCREMSSVRHVPKADPIKGTPSSRVFLRIDNSLRLTHEIHFRQITNISQPIESRYGLCGRRILDEVRLPGRASFGLPREPGAAPERGANRQPFSDTPRGRIDPMWSSSCCRCQTRQEPGHRRPGRSSVQGSPRPTVSLPAGRDQKATVAGSSPGSGSEPPSCRRFDRSATGRRRRCSARCLPCGSRRRPRPRRHRARRPAT